MTEQNQTAQEETDTVVQVPIVHVDATRIAVHPYTVHVQFGSTMPDGTTWPRVHLTMSPEFALHLHQALAEALLASSPGAAGE